MEQVSWQEIGRIVGAHGLEGEVRVYPTSDFPERFLEPGQRWVRRSGAETPEALDLVKGRYLEPKGLYILKFKQIQHRDAAESLHKAQLLVPATDRPALELGEFYVADLIGLKVVLQETQAVVGTVVDLYEAGNDLLLVELIPTDRSAEEATPATPKTVFIPFVEEIVPTVDIAQGFIEVNPPQGLLEG